MLCLFASNASKLLVTQNAYGAELDRAYDECPTLERYVEWKRHVGHLFDDANIDAIVTRFNTEVRQHQFECWRTRRVAPRLVHMYAAVAALAQAAFDATAPSTVLDNRVENWEEEAKMRAWKYQVSSLVLDAAKLRLQCVHNATTIAAANAKQCAMPWDDAPSTDRAMDLQLPPTRAELPGLGYYLVRLASKHLDTTTMPLTLADKLFNGTDADADKRYQYVFQTLTSALRWNDDLGQWRAEMKKGRCEFVQFF